MLPWRDTAVYGANAPEVRRRFSCNGKERDELEPVIL